MIASFSIKSFTRVDNRFFKSLTVKEELSLQFETFGSDKPMIAFSKFFKLPFNWFYKIFNLFWLFHENILERSKIMCSILFSGIKGPFRSVWYFQWYVRVFWVSWNIADISSGDYCISGMAKDVICVAFSVSGTIMVMLSTWVLSVKICLCVCLILYV